MSGLSGIPLRPATAHLIDETARIVREHSAPTDTIFVYPEFGILYPLYDRRYSTATDSHNIGVVNDEFAHSAASARSEPAVIIYYPVPECSLRADERSRRHGQLDLIAAIGKLTSTYQLVTSFHIPPNENPVKAMYGSNGFSQQ